jgi:hypothetical protein
MSVDDRKQRMRSIAGIWSERAIIAGKHGQTDLAEVSLWLASKYQQLGDSELEEPEVLARANLLRKRIESSEQHRTMSVEHGLGDEAIDVTYEIQELERELVVLVHQAMLDPTNQMMD